jgi:transposase-like protein
MASKKKSNPANRKFANRYPDATKAALVARVEEMKAQGQTGALHRAAREFGVSYPSATDWYRRAKNGSFHSTAVSSFEGRNKPKPDATRAAREEAEAVADVMANEAVSDHASGGIHPMLTAYEDAQERYDHQRTVVDTLHAELSVHSDKLAELERSMNDAKKALQEIVNSL